MELGWQTESASPYRGSISPEPLALVLAEYTRVASRSHRPPLPRLLRGLLRCSVLKQGNRDFYRKEALVSRRALRNHPDIRSVIASFWEAVHTVASRSPAIVSARAHTPTAAPNIVHSTFTTHSFPPTTPSPSGQPFPYCPLLFISPRSRAPAGLSQVPDLKALRRGTATARQMFDEYDHDNGGSISLEELRHLCYRLGVYLSHHQANIVVRSLDADGSGKLDYDEFLTWWLSSDVVKAG